MTKLKVYEEAPEEAPKRSEGLIKHPWYALAGAAIVGAVVGFLFRRRR